MERSARAVLECRAHTLLLPGHSSGQASLAEMRSNP